MTDNIDTAPAGLDELDEFPKIKKLITNEWGTQRLQEYLEGLLADTRNNTRKGFPAGMSKALVKLSLANRRALTKRGLSMDDNPTSQFAVSGWTIPKNF